MEPTTLFNPRGRNWNMPQTTKQYQSQTPPAAANEQNVLVKKTWGLLPFSRTPSLHRVLLGIENTTDVTFIGCTYEGQLAILLSHGIWC